MGTFKTKPNQNNCFLGQNLSLNLREAYITYKKLGLLNNLSLDVETEKQLLSDAQSACANTRRSAEKIIIKNYFKLSFSLASKFYFKIQGRIDLDDLISEGSRAIIKAISKFKIGENENVRFGTYATYWINKYLYDYSISNFSIIKFITTKDDIKVFYKINKVIKNLNINKKVEDLDYKEVKIIANELNVSNECIIKNISCANILSISHLEFDNESDNQLNCIENKIDITKNLNKEENFIYSSLFVNDLSLEETAKKINSNRETIRIKKNLILKKIAKSFALPVY